jgi:PAS domain S-box-containing protein
MRAAHTAPGVTPLTPDDYVDVLAQTGMGMVCILDPTGKIMLFDAACERATGFAAADVVGRDARETVIPPDEAAAFGDFMAQLADAPSPSPQIGHWMTAAGDRRLIAWSNRPLFGEDGESMGLLTVGIDLTERERASAELRALHAELRRRLAEQAALRRVATLVAAEADPAHVFTVVAEEAAAVAGADASAVVRYDAEGNAEVVGRHGGDPSSFPVGATIPVDPDSALGRVLKTGEAARAEPDEASETPLARAMRASGYRSAEAAPIWLGGGPWGAIVVVGRDVDALPDEPHSALAPFADLLALALASADARERLLESRARLVEAADGERRRVERDLHDGAQQRLVTLALQLRAARRAAAGAGADERLDGLLETAEAEARGALEDLRDLARGLHPAVLSEHGLAAALRALAQRAPLPVAVDHVSDLRFPPTVEVAAYYVVAEALTNVAKHAGAKHVTVAARPSDGRLVVTVADDGRGGANPGGGTGLCGLADRVEALRGTLEITSTPAGTVLRAELPIPL